MDEFFRENVAAHEAMDCFDVLQSAKNFAKKTALHMLSTSLTEKAETAEKQTYWILRFLRYSRMLKFPPGWREKAYKAVPQLRSCHGPDGSAERRKAHDFLMDAIQKTCEERLDCIKRLALPVHVRRERNDRIRKRMQQWAPKRKFVGIALVHHNSVDSQPSQVAAGLVEHWAPVFTARPVDEDLL